MLAAGVADYSRFLASDDPETENILDARRELFLRVIAEHDGRSYKTSGDSLAAEFSNAVDAVRCAVAIQQESLKENETLRPEQRVLLRIGLNIGDVIEDNGSFRGDGVDVAVRFETLAVPGGICLSRSVYEQVKHRINVGIEFAGEFFFYRGLFTCT